MGRALRAEPEPVAEKRKRGRPLGSTKKKKEEVKGEAEEDVYMEEQFGGASGSGAPREAKRPADWRDDAWYGKRRRSARIATKRQRDAAMQELLEREEVEVRGDPVGAVGPPWRDEYTGEVLPPEEVEKAMDDERA
eukprot:8598702-Heterocapsa_arctica.AAC.1